MRKLVGASAVWFCLLCVPVLAQTPPTFTAGQAVEVREGDSWSAATFESREGRKYHIKYTDGGTEEWVTGDRIRLPGGAPAAVPTTKPAADVPADAVNPPAAPADANKPAAKPRATYSAGDQLEVKWGLLWRKATVVNKRTGDWYLMNYTPGSSREWVEWWRLRKIGSTDDISNASPNSFYHNGDDPPRPDAGDGPAPENKPSFGRGSHGGANNNDVPFSQPIVDADLSASHEVLPTFDGNWAVAPDPVDPKLIIGTSGIPLKSGASRGRNSSMLHAGSIAALVVRDEFGPEMKSITVEKINLATGSSQGLLTFDNQSYPLAVSPSGKRILARSNGWGFGKNKRVDLWTIDGATPQHVISFVPMAKGSDVEADIISGDFIDDDHAYTLLHGGDLIVWDIAKGKAIWMASLEEQARVAISPGRKYLYGMRDDQLICFDAMTGTPQGAIAGGQTISGSIDISPDGTRLVGASGMVVSVYDLQAGKFLGDIGLPAGSKTGDVAALPDHFALIGPQLMDLDKYGVIWSYTDTLHPFVAGGRCWNLLVPNMHVSLVNAKLPSEAARKADGMMMAAAQLLLKPGDRVALDVSIEAPADQVTKVTAALKKQIEKSGLTVDPSASVHIIARTQNGQTFTEHYRSTMANPFSQGEAVSITDKITSLSVESDGKVAWMTQTINRPGMIVTRRGDQSIADAVGAADTFKTDFLETTRLPNYVLKPLDRVGFGDSKWALGGVKDDAPDAKPDAK